MFLNIFSIKCFWNVTNFRIEQNNYVKFVNNLVKVLFIIEKYAYEYA
jgi:hypothetical protein